ncbi:hypothetical protein [Mycolicibacterium hippocampi]|uniref:Secreted protein n=1 Tax=Mycolicibacterium hippocampi TaxID=659824 RepID=A0A7I9ZRY6_9MYCO|nr:hypothetical protein [Mycolicibacterium hippocampi]GFH03487.1 hypothetical protein MHIP_39700 [Mycolicibacterium hippocampi]
MPRIMRFTRAAAAMVIAVSAFAGGIGVSAASADAAETFLPFSQALRRCDFSEMQYVGGTGYARATAQVRTDGADVVADVQIATGRPDTRYEVRLIQAPRTSAVPCNAGDTGVTGGVMITDDAGGARITLRGPTMSGATGAWLMITRPSAHSQIPAEFYTTDTIAAF